MSFLLLSLCVRGVDCVSFRSSATSRDDLMNCMYHSIHYSRSPSLPLPKNNWMDPFFWGGGSCSFTKNGRRNTWNGSTTTAVPSVMPSTRSAKGCSTLPLPSLSQIRRGIRRHRLRGAATVMASSKGRRSTTSRGFRRNRNSAAPMPSQKRSTAGRRRRRPSHGGAWGGEVPIRPTTTTIMTTTSSFGRRRAPKGGRRRLLLIRRRPSNPRR